MRGHNVGVLVATSRGLSPTGDNDSQIDRQSGGDLVEALARLGVRTTALTADESLDLTLRQTPVDACLLAAHGDVGGRGQIQAFLELRGIAFVGPSSQAAGLAYDKLRARQILAYHSLPVPPTLSLGAERPTAAALGLLGWPCVLKPRRGSHGRGVRLLEDAAAVHEAVAAHEGDFLLERAVLGREIQVVLLHGRALGAMELDRDPAAPAQIRAMTCPPALSRSQLRGICNLAEHAGRALGLGNGATRVDILVHPRHNEVILEVEPLPALHRDGVVAKVARAAGLRYDALVAGLLQDLVDVPRAELPVPPKPARPPVEVGVGLLQ